MISRSAYAKIRYLSRIKEGSGRLLCWFMTRSLIWKRLRRTIKLKAITISFFFYINGIIV